MRRARYRHVEALALIAIVGLGLWSLPFEAADQRVYLWPRLVLFLLLAVAAGNWLFAGALIAAASQPNETDNRSVLLSFAFMLFYMAFTVLMDWVGFIVAAPIFLFTFMLWIRRIKGIKVSVYRLIGLTALIYITTVVIFLYAFQLFMPYGVGWLRVLNEYIVYQFR